MIIDLIGNKKIKNASLYSKLTIDDDIHRISFRTENNLTILPSFFTKITNDNEIIYTYPDFQPEKKALLFDLNKKAIFMKGIYLVIQRPYAHNNYYHWVYQVFSTLIVAKKIGFKIDKINILGSSLQKQTFQFQYINFFKHINYINIPVNSKVIIETGIFSNLVHSHEKIPSQILTSAFNDFKNFIIKNKGNNKSKKNIYITRKNATNGRNITNEKRLINMIQKYNFHVINLDQINVIEQIKIFNEANIIIGGHGAGLTNLLYCKNNIYLIELFTQNLIRRCYASICIAKSIKYIGILNETENISKINAVYENYKVDLDLIEYYINNLNEFTSINSAKDSNISKEKIINAFITSEDKETQAEALLALGKNEEAFNIYKNLITKNKNLFEIYNRISFILEKQNNFFEAIKYLDKALALNTNAYWLKEKIINLHIKNKDFNSAKLLLKDTFCKNKERGWPYIQMAYIYELEKNIEKAIKLVKTGINKSPEKVWYNDYLIKLLRQNNKLDEAKEIAEKLIKFDINLEWAHLHLSFIYEKSNDIKKAIYFLNNAIKLSPETSWYYERLQTLKKSLNQNIIK